MDAHDDLPDGAAPSVPGSLVPSDHAQRLADELVTADSMQKELLLEAESTGEETGRSICGSTDKAKAAEDSTYSSVVLPACPIDRRALMHGGGGHDLAAPRHSLLDMANVLWGLADASMVVGAQESDVFLAPQEAVVEDAQAVFENALGIKVTGPDDVEAALAAGRVTNPPEARGRIRRELPALFRTVSTTHPELLTTTTASAPAVPMDAALDALTSHRQRTRRTVDMLSESVEGTFTFDLSSVEVNLAQMVVGQFADAIVLLVFLYLMGGRPSQVIRQNTS